MKPAFSDIPVLATCQPDAGCDLLQVASCCLQCIGLEVDG